MLKIGLTGGIGSGKSTVTQLLKKLGTFVIDIDAISRALTQKGGAAIPKIQATFGTQFITPDGAMDRGAMRTLIFTNSAAKEQLEAIIHPLIQQAVHQELERSQELLYVVLDVPLLFETGYWTQVADRICIVDCEVPTQIQRTMQRSGLTAEEVQLILDVQVTREERLALADDVILNDAATTLQELEQRVILQHMIWTKLP